MFQRRENLYLTLLAIALAFLSYYFYSDTITLFPSFFHAWTQSDRFAITLCFLENGMNLFRPCTFNLMTVEGITAVDLPVFEYIIAWIMKLTGNESALIQRLFTLLYSLTGLSFLYRSGRLLGASIFQSAAVVIFTFTCPVIVYYQAGFVPSPYSMASVFIGYYFYLRYLKNNQISGFGWSVFFLALASIYRTPFNIFLFALVLQMTAKTVMHRKVQRKAWVYLGLAYIAIASNALYKNYLEDMYGSMFLTELMYPHSFNEFKDLLHQIWNTWQWHYFTGYHYLFIIGILLLTFIRILTKRNINRLQKQWLFLTLLTICGGTIYLIIMLKQFPAHDYYLIDSLYPGIIMMLIFGASILPRKPVWSIAFIILALGTLPAGILQSRSIQQERYTHNFWDDGETTRQNFIGSAAFLDSMGISREVKILVLDAYSTNAPLILMKRRGYTVQHTTKENLDSALVHFNYDYVVIQDQYLPHAIMYNYPEIVNHLLPIAHNGKISVYEFQEENLHQNILDLLPVDDSKKWELNFEDSIHPGWENQYPVKKDFTSGNFIIIDGEYGPVFQQKAHKLVGRKLLFEMTFLNDEGPKDFAITANVSDGYNTLYYHSIPVRFHQTESSEKFQCLFVLPENLKGDETVKCHLYNLETKNIRALSFKATSY